MISKKVGLIILLILLFVLAGLFTISENESDINLDKGPELPVSLELQNSGESNIRNIGLSDITPGEILNYTEPEETGLNFSGDIITCSNITDTEQVVDIRLTNYDMENKSITIYPMNLTINLLPKQIKRIDIPLPYNISVLTLTSSTGEELDAQVPLCFSRGSSGSATISFATETIPPEVKEIPEFPSIGLPVIAILVMLFLMKKKNN